MERIRIHQFGLILLAVGLFFGVGCGANTESPIVRFSIIDSATMKPIAGAVIIAGPAAEAQTVVTGVFRADTEGKIALPFELVNHQELRFSTWSPGYLWMPQSISGKTGNPVVIDTSRPEELTKISSDPREGQLEIANLKALLTELAELRVKSGGSFTYQEGITYDELRDEITTELEIATMLAEDYRESAELLDYSESADGEISPENE